MKSSRHFRRTALILAGSIAALAAAPAARAATLIWDPTSIPASPVGGPGTWDTTNAFWSNGVIDSIWNNANNDIAVFGGAAGTGIITLGTAITAGGITFNAPTSGTNYSISGAQTLTLSSGAAITVNATTATISSALAGTNWTKAGTGTLTLQTTADTFTGNATVSAGTLAVNIGQSATAGFLLANGTTLTTNQALATGNVITALSGASTLTLSALATFSAPIAGNGNLTISNGTTQINAFGTGGSAATNNELANFGGTLTFGSSFTIRSLSFSSGTGALNAAYTNFDFASTTGAITSRNGTSTFILGGIASASTGANVGGNASGGTNTVVVGSANKDTSFAGFIANGSALGTLLTKVGTGTLTLTGVMQNTGADAFNGGTLKLDYTVNPTGVLNATSTLNFAGGNLSLLGKNSGATTQSSGNLQVNAGGGRLIVDPNGGTSTTLTLGTLNTGVAGGTLNIQPSDATLGSGTAAIKTTSVLTTTGTSAATSIYSSRFTYGSDWLTGGTASLSTLAAYSSYADLTTTIGAATNVTNDRLNNVGNATMTGNFTTNTLKITNSTAQSLDLGGNTLALTTGSLLFSGSADYSIGTAVNNGTLKPTSTELILQDLGTGSFTINSVIANGSAASALTKGGFGTLTLTGTNTYTGSTFLNGGTTSIGAAAGLGAPVAASVITLNGGTLQATGSFSLPGGSTGGLKVGGGGGTFDVTGANNLNLTGVISVVNANQFGPLTKIGTGTLTLSGANTYGGATIIRAGILSTGSLANGGTTSGIGNSANAAPALILDGGTLQYTGAVQSTDRTFTLTQNGGALDASGSAALTYSSTLPEAYSGSGARTLTFTGSNTNNNTFVAPITDASATAGASGVVSLAKTGAGKWVLSGTHTYTGNTTISGGGTLALSAASNNTISSSPTITVGSGSTLDVSGLTSGTLALTSTQTLKGGGTVVGGISTVSGSTITPGSSVGTLTVGSITLTTGSIFNYEFNTSPANDLIAVTANNGLTLNGGGLNLLIENTANKFTTPGTYNLFTFVGSIQGTGLDSSWTTAINANPHILNPQTGLTYAFGSSGPNLFLTIGGTAALIAQWTSLTDGNWSDGTRWDSNPTYPTAAGDTASFTTAQSSPRTVTLNGSQTVGTINFNSAAPNGYTVAVGSGSLTLDNTTSNSVISVFTGAHTINPAIALTTNTNITVTNSGDSLTLGGVVSNTAGAKTIAKSGAGKLVLSNANTYGLSAGTVGTTLAAGTIEIGSNTALGAGDVAVTGAATLAAGAANLNAANNIVVTGGVTAAVDTQANTLTLSGVISQTAASGAVTKTGSGTLKLSGTNTYTGATTVSNGTLQLGDAGVGGSVAGNIVNNAALALNRTDDYTLGNVISGTGTLTQAGTDNVTLSAANTFTGDTAVSAGTLTLGNSLALQNSTLNYNNQGGVLSFGSLTAATLGGLKGAQNLLLENATPGVAVALSVGGNSQSTTYSGALSGTGSLTKNGTGTLILTGNNSYGGSTTVNTGTLQLPTGGVINGGVLAGSGFLINGGSLTSSGTSTFAASNTAFLQTSGTSSVGTFVSNANDGTLFSITGGNFTASAVTLQRTASFTTAPTIAAPIAASTTSGLYINGATTTASLGTLTIGTGNSSASARIDNGTVTATGQVTIGRTTNSRWSILQVNGGSFTSTDTTNGIVLSANNGASTNNSELYLSGGTTTAEKIAFGVSTDALGGNGFLIVNGGTLYVGSGGIVQPNVSGLYTTTIGLTSGTVGAKASWSSALPMQLSGSNFTFKAADAANVANDITLSGFLSGPGGLSKTGAGTLTLNGAGNAYTGLTAINGGALNINSVYALGGGVYAGLTFGANGGTLQYAATLLNGATDVTQDTSDGGLGINGVAKNVTLTGNAIIDTNGNNVSYKNTFGNSGGGSLTKIGAGTLTLAGAGTFTGATTVNAGTLEVAGTGALTATTAIAVNSGGTLLLSGTGGTNTKLNTAATLSLDSGTLSASGMTTTLDQTLGTLTLTTNSIIDFGTLAAGNTFHFADSSGIIWGGGAILSIYNWTDGADHLFFGNGSGTGLQQSQLDQIKFYSDGGGMILPFAPGYSGFTGGVGEVVPVPEPSSVATVLGLLGLVGWRERRKDRRVRQSERREAFLKI